MKWFTGAVLVFNLLCVIIITLYGWTPPQERDQEKQEDTKEDIDPDTYQYIHMDPVYRAVFLNTKKRSLDTSTCYSFFSIIFIPCNSVINPIGILEDKTLNLWCGNKFLTYCGESADKRPRSNLLLIRSMCRLE